jgi:hypothetical protein
MFWANARGHTVITDRDHSVDVIVATENADLSSAYFTDSRVPIIFDLVDAYLSPVNLVDDLARGIAKGISGQLSGVVKPFSHQVRDFCRYSSAVICSSPEQAEVIKSYNTNVHVILDSHDEVPLVKPQKPRSLTPDRHHILWEGQPATIRGIKFVSSVISDLSKRHQLNLDFVTDLSYYQFLNRYIQRSTHNLLIKDLGHLVSLANIVPWTPQNLLHYAKGSTAAMIPIDLSIPMQRLKPENRLLIMWRLGLPCLTSPSPAYSRVSKDAGVETICETPEVWLHKFDELLSDPIIARQQVLRGQEYLLDMHNRDSLLAKWDRAIESVLR